METIQELFGKVESLDRELQPYVSEHETLGRVLKHPLLFEVPLVPGMEAITNRRYRLKSESLAKAIRKRDWGSVLALHERAYRWVILDDVSGEIEDRELADHFVWVWTDSESIFENRVSIRRLMKRVANAPRSALMDKDDLKRFDSLPATVRVYRGYTSLNPAGLSWTLNREKAEWFAKRFSATDPRVLEGDVKKSGILFYTNRRGEDEVVVKNLHHSVKVIRDDRI